MNRSSTRLRNTCFHDLGLLLDAPFSYLAKIDNEACLSVILICSRVLHGVLFGSSDYGDGVPQTVWTFCHRCDPRRARTWEMELACSHSTHIYVHNVQARHTRWNTRKYKSFSFLLFKTLDGEGSPLFWWHHTELQTKASCDRRYCDRSANPRRKKSWLKWSNLWVKMGLNWLGRHEELNDTRTYHQSVITESVYMCIFFGIFVTSD